MTPAQPPPPTIWNLPFQFSAGNHTSISMCESVVGCSTAATRQCAARMMGVGCGAAPRPGVAYGPAGTSSAAVMVVSGSVSDFRLSQGVDDAYRLAVTRAMAMIIGDLSCRSSVLGC